MTGKKTHLELQKWDTNDLTINSLALYGLLCLTSVFVMRARGVV